MRSTYSELAARSADGEQESIGPIPAISFDKSGSPMAYAVTYDWEEVPTRLFPLVIVIF